MKIELQRLWTFILMKYTLEEELEKNNRMSDPDGNASN